MRYLYILLFPLLLFSSQLKEILRGVDNSLLVRSSISKTKALQKVVGVAKAKRYPKVDLSFSAIRLKDTPTATFILPHMPPINSIVGTKDNVYGAIEFVYPIFTGYLIENSIKKAKLQVIKSKLQTENLKRELYLKSIKLYSDIYALNQAIKATKEALKALDISLEKAQKLYKNSLINLSEVYNIKAKKYDMIANLQTLRAKKSSLQNLLFYISGVRVKEYFRLPQVSNVVNENEAIKEAINKREDIRVIKKELDIGDSDVSLAKSRYYPDIALIGGVKKEGDNLRLNGNGFSNADKSYIGISLKWNLFSGFERRRGVEAVVLKKEATKLFLDDYKVKVKVAIKNSFLTLKSLYAKLQAAKEELKSQREYCKLVRGRFNNALSSADELSRAIASLSKAKAKFEQYKAKIFFQKYKILLQTGIDALKEDS